jgi:NADH-quinone oxidoreductase E subunit
MTTIISTTCQRFCPANPIKNAGFYPKQVYHPPWIIVRGLAQWLIMAVASHAEDRKDDRCLAEDSMTPISHAEAPATVGRPIYDSASNIQNRSRLLAALYIAQEQYGWLSPEAIQRVANRLGLSAGQVYSTASFYTMFRLEPQGRYRIQVCEGLSCYLVGGAEPIIEHVARRLEITPGQTTPDGQFTLEVVECLAACDVAPALKVNDELHGHVTPDKIDELLAELAKRGA